MSGQPNGTDSSDVRIDRRAFVRWTGGGLLVGAVGAQALIEACSSPAPPAATSQPATTPLARAAATPGSAIKGKNAAVMPTYAPPKLTGQPDYHSSDPRITDGYDRYPANPVKTWTKEAPGLGSNVSVFIVAYYPASTPYAQNKTWQEVNRQLNANVQFNAVPGSDYPVKIGTIMAGSDLPDIIHIYNGISAAPNLPDFFKAQCADLTPYLAGDAALDYPNLAAIPTYAWFNSQCAIDGKLYQWPIHRYLPLLGNYMVSDVYDKAFGTGYVPRDLDDWNRMLRLLNDPNNGMWAMGAAPGPPRFFGLYGYSAMFGAPNNWRLDSSGKLTKDLETEELKATVGWMRDTWNTGLWYPDSLQLADARTNGFVPGKFATTIEAFGNSWNDF
jgi:putative aldouronate transport system substrate-binding protein